MFKMLIFGGTTEGRQLAEFCVKNEISADICVTTPLGAELIGRGNSLKIRVGKLDFEGILQLLANEKYSLVADATHPYAVLATENIRAACCENGTEYYRILRENSECDFGEIAHDTNELVELLNRSTKRILSTLGSNEAETLTRVSDYKNRVFLRILPDEKNIEKCVRLGFPREKIIVGKGPFSVKENICHICGCKAEILVTKNSGKAGGYPEKAEAARACKIEMITLLRPRENGISISEFVILVLKKLSEGGDLP